MERRKFLKFFGFTTLFPFLNMPVTVTENPRQILLAEFFIAGFQYHDGMRPEIFQALNEGDELLLQREPDNPHDPLAIAIFRGRGDNLGYVPRSCNYVPALIADQDVRICAEIAEIYPDAESWERVLVRLWQEV